MLAYAAQNLCFLNADAKNNGALRKQENTAGIAAPHPGTASGEFNPP